MELNKKLIYVILIGIILLGVGFRFYKITENQFIYYDEGLYLQDTNKKFLDTIDKYPPQSVEKLLKYISVSVKLSLFKAKPIWFFISDLRAYIFNEDSWFFTRVISAIFASLTLVLLFFFAKRFYNSNLAGLLSAAFLAVLPSHVFYSRLGMQEALSVFLFLAGFYIYFFPRKLNFLRAIFSGVVFSSVFFTNYRMIIIPIFILAAEILLSLSAREKPNIRKFFLSAYAFFFCVFFIGNLYHGANTKAAFGWIFHQAQLAENKFDIFNIFSFPYYIFKLESALFGLILFANIFYFYKGLTYFFANSRYGSNSILNLCPFFVCET